jgi:hypothetical protein
VVPSGEVWDGSGWTEVEDARRLRVADAELEAARVAYEAAQDLPAPVD